MTEALNFLLTNRLPRVALSRFMGWFSTVEQPLVARTSLALWRAFADLRLEEAKKSSFASLHDCFTRELKDGARPAERDPSVLTSPCDAIVGAGGAIEGTRVYQIKGMPYGLGDLLRDDALCDRFRDGTYATLRITSSMYHRFHAPHDLRVTRVTRFPGDAWNVNPPALKRVEKLFCRNERAVVSTLLGSGQELLLVPVAAILVAGIRLAFEPGAAFAKGQQMGWFEHGSTIVVIAPRGFRLLAAQASLIRAGQPLMRLPG
jgi:phosphatidylserine decarboxylase